MHTPELIGKEEPLSYREIPIELRMYMSQLAVKIAKQKRLDSQKAIEARSSAE
jgi:hypothetical protein